MFLEPRWTDDTSMGLCLADSLLVCRGHLVPGFLGISISPEIPPVNFLSSSLTGQECVRLPYTHHGTAKVQALTLNVPAILHVICRI